MSNVDEAQSLTRRSSARGEFVWGLVLLAAGLAMRFGHSLVELPMVNLARTGEVVASIGVLCLAYGVWLMVRRD